jgi:ATP-dependent helicase/nuclease subunit B
MNEIAKSAQSPALDYVSHLVEMAWRDPSSGLIARLRDQLRTRQIDPAQVVLLMPYAQLLPVARAAWLEAVPTGFAPRMETTASWVRSLGAVPAQHPDISLDRSRDMLAARALLEDAGLRDEQDALAPLLVDAAWQLLRAAGAIAPDLRPAWGERARAVIEPTSLTQLTWEAATARIALEWALASSCATDVLFSHQALPAGIRAVAVLAGLQPDALTESLCAFWQARGLSILRLDLFPDMAQRPSEGHAKTDGHGGPYAAVGEVAAGAARGLRAEGAPSALLHVCADSEDEAERAAACVLRRVQAGQCPVALVAVDRALTRRISAVLGAHGAAIADETGWTLSTTRAAAQLMSTLQACRAQASGDAVLDWLKEIPTVGAGEVEHLEAALRRDGARVWRDWEQATRAQPDRPSRALSKAEPDRAGFCARIESFRSQLRTSRPLAEWLAALAALLTQTGQWEPLQADAAGRQVCEALWLDLPIGEAFAQSLSQTRWANRRLDLSAFSGWVREALESQSFLPEAPARDGATDVVVVPMAQLAARPFAAVVIPGCDEQRLPSSPDPIGAWTPQQREVLGLPSRAQLQAVVASAWQAALRVPLIDILWREGDAAGEVLQSSPLVQGLLAEARNGSVSFAEDPRGLRPLSSQRIAPPLPCGAALPVRHLSASAYEDLRKCPYRFFSLRQLGLRDAAELEADIDKRDFGLWLHAVLSMFHVDSSVSTSAAEVLDAKSARLDFCAAEATRQLGLADDEFLPFAATWPATRDGYLRWLAHHESQGFAFEAAETWRRQGLGALDLVGQIDRIDSASLSPLGGDGRLGAVAAEAPVFVIDYKTESLETTKKRVAQAGEDTQLAFYAALLPQDTLRAAYVNVGERGDTKTIEQEDVVEERDRLLAGIRHDVQRIADGVPLPALGEGAVCDTCSVRGLCRKDFWSVE